MSRLFCIILIAVCLFFGGKAEAQAKPIEIVLSPIPPLVMTENGKHSGLLWDMGKRLITRLKAKLDVEINEHPNILPWQRAYNELTQNSHIIMLQMARTQEREKLFEWIEPTINLSFAFVTKKPPVLNNFDDAKQVKTIAVYRGSRLEKYLRAQGFDKTLILTNNSLNSARLLNGGRVDAWYASVQEALWLYNEKVITSAPFIGQPMLETPVWAVTAKGMSPEVTALIQNELQLMKIDGIFSLIKEKYGLARS